MKRWGLKGAEAPPVFFQPSHSKFEPPLSPPFQKFITTVHPIALQRWCMASFAVRFFSSLIPSNQPTSFCNCVTKVKKIENTVGFPGKVGYKLKLSELFYDVTVKFSPMLKKNVWANNSETTNLNQISN